MWALNTRVCFLPPCMLAGACLRIVYCAVKERESHANSVSEIDRWREGGREGGVVSVCSICRAQWCDTEASEAQTGPISPCPPPACLSFNLADARGKVITQFAPGDVISARCPLCRTTHTRAHVHTASHRLAGHLCKCCCLNICTAVMFFSFLALFALSVSVLAGSAAEFLLSLPIFAACIVHSLYFYDGWLQFHPVVLHLR